MHFYTYFTQKFSDDIRKLTFTKRQPAPWQSAYRGDYLLLYGGRRWEHMPDDLQVVPAERRELFVYALLIMTLSDQTIYTYFRHFYPHWRRATLFPKFAREYGYPGMQNPFYLLVQLQVIPAGYRLINFERAEALIPEVIDSFDRLVQEAVPRFIPTDCKSDFFKTICNDPAITLDKENSHIMKSFRAEFLRRYSTISD